jgi:hypothetical protein
MIKTVEGNAIDYVLENPNKRFLLHCVNAQGKFASGIAGEIRKRIPSAYESYMKDHHLGSVTYSNKCMVVNMCAQELYGRDGKQYVDYDVLGSCLSQIEEDWHSCNFEFVFPYKVCCGLAGGDWDEVQNIIKRELGGEDITYVKLP